MSDQDLGGDAVKVARYRILFTKPGLEAALQEGTEVMGYPADAASWTGRGLSDFLSQVKQGRVPRPAAWRQAGYAVPAVGKGENEWTIPEGGQKYLTCRYDVLERFSGADEGLEKAHREVIAEIRKAVESNYSRSSDE
jgi:hypothetical protein